MHNLQCNEHRFRPMSDQFSSRIISSNGRPALKALMVPGSLNFGDVIVGTESAKQVVTLLNEGYLPLQISAIRWVGDFHVTTDAPANGELPVNGYCSFTVTYRPTADGNSSGALYVDTLNTEGNTFITLQGRGVDSMSGPGGGGGSFIPWVYNGGSANGGELTLTVTENTVGVPELFLNGLHQEVGLGFTFDPDTAVITLADQLEEGDEVIAHLSGVPANPDNPNIDNWHVVNWLYNEGSAIGGEQVLVIPYTFQTIVAVFKNGLRYVANLLDESFSFSTSAQSVTLTEALVPGDRVVVQIGGEFSVIEMSDRTLYEVARSANVPDSAVILSNDQIATLNGKTAIYDVVAKKIWAIPSGIPSGATVGSVSGSTLTYSPGAVAVTLVELADDSFLLVKQPYNGSKLRNQSDKNAEFVSLFDFSNITGDGVANDTAGIAVVEALSSAPIIYGFGRTYKVDAIPTSKRYSDGWWLVGSSLIPFDYISTLRANNNIIAIGSNAGASVAGARNCIAIGQDAMRYNVFGRHNICIGISAGMFLNGLNPSSIEGSRNLLIGGNSGRFMSTGNRNIIFGRDAGHNITTGSLNIIIGNGAVMGDGPNTLDPGVIENQTPLTPSYATMIGTEAGKYFNSGYTVGIGYNAAQNTKSDASLVAIGPLAFRDYQTDVSYWGTNQLLVSKTGTYSQTGTTTIAILCTAHGLTTGFRVLMRFTSGANGDTTFNDDNWYLVTVVDANNFTIQSPVTATASGNISISKVSTTTAYSGLFGGCVGIGREVGNGVSNYRSTGIGDRVGALGLGVENTGIGYQVFNLVVPGAGNTAVGAYSQTKISGGGNTSLGVLSLTNATTATNNTGAGAQALRNITTGSNNTAVGSGALRGATTATTSTAIGVDAGRFAVDGTDANFSNSTALGFNAKVAGANQVQIGDPSTTTYVFGTVGNRSDIRDKAEVEETLLGIDFINGLRAVSGKWNMRDDYYTYTEVYQGQNDTNGHPIYKTVVTFDEEGYLAETKKRTRLHQWFIAQEVVKLIEDLGLNPDDYGLVQHSAVNGGADIYTLGYDEFIPPVVKSIQDCWSRMDEQDKEIQALKERLSKAGL